MSDLRLAHKARQGRLNALASLRISDRRKRMQPKAALFRAFSCTPFAVNEEARLFSAYDSLRYPH